ncbi:phosphotransferase [Paenibacillus sp. CGMCC 1.16610]|uniref:Phosphotransferase n=2 Tax=Paenibacillus TaxID=44249 RepID=A0ABW9U6T1_9BACL|nr:phosphotransferase [Paenibacillus anseongense]MBA2938897.1 phosphotransferase [Paenibacillus sp. CGMCC 1.16610]MVQ34859.1 phosphotransferase [Paenibacillus anseongense]
MDKNIKQLFNQDILRQAAECYGIREDSIIELNGFQNFVFSGLVGDREVILRIAHNAHRGELLTKAEIEFILFLAESGVKVAKPIQSLSGDLLHVIDHAFIVTAFEKVLGRNAKIAEESNSFYENIGQFVGKIHKYSLHYTPQHFRYEWNENALLTSFKNNCPPELFNSFDRLIEEVSALAKDKNTYGLIHGDVSCGNYLNDGDNANIIDFDEAEYSWFVSDIATPLFYEIPIPWVVDGEVRKEITKRYFSNFLNGYCKENTISQEWLKKIPLFIDLRQARVLSALYRSRDFNAPDWSKWDEQARRFYYSNLLNSTPYIDLDFSRM